LRANNIRSHCIFEADVLHLDAFAPYVKEIQDGGRGEVETLLSSCKNLVSQWSVIDEVYVMDSIFPCYDWLFSAGYLEAEIRHFSRRLTEVLQEFDPLLIFLTGDIRIALSRASQSRGRQWEDALTEHRCGGGRFKNLPDYFAKMRNISLKLLKDWPFEKIVIDTTSVGDWKNYEDQILNHLGLKRINARRIIHASENRDEI
jgi:hypothetical protein